MDKNNRDKWINDTIESLNGVKQAEASPFLFAKVLHRVKQEATGGFIPAKRAALGFMTIIILAVINIAVIMNLNTTTETVQTGITVTGNTVTNEFIPSQTNPYLEILSK